MERELYSDHQRAAEGWK